MYSRPSGFLLLCYFLLFLSIWLQFVHVLNVARRLFQQIANVTRLQANSSDKTFACTPTA